jgi:regulator of replication initiation timing
VSLFDSLASALKIRGKDHKIKDAKNTIHEMTRRINQLELENAKLKNQIDKGQDNTSL